MNDYTLNARLTCGGTAIGTSDFENEWFDLALEQTDTTLKANVESGVGNKSAFKQ